MSGRLDLNFSREIFILLLLSLLSPTRSFSPENHTGLHPRPKLLHVLPVLQGMTNFISFSLFFFRFLNRFCISPIKCSLFDFHCYVTALPWPSTNFEQTPPYITSFLCLFYLTTIILQVCQISQLKCTLQGRITVRCFALVSQKRILRLGESNKVSFNAQNTQTCQILELDLLPPHFKLISSFSFTFPGFYIADF